MACITKVVADIVNDCSARPVKGLRPKAWIFNGGEFTYSITNNTVTAITPIGAADAFTAEGFKDFMNAGHEAVVAENLPTAYRHRWTINAFAATAAEKANIDKADNIAVVVQNQNGTLSMYGVKHGLWKVSQTKMANDNNAQVMIEFASREGMEEEYSEYVFTGSVATLTALE